MRFRRSATGEIRITAATSSTRPINPILGASVPERYTASSPPPSATVSPHFSRICFFASASRSENGAGRPCQRTCSPGRRYVLSFSSILIHTPFVFRQLPAIHYYTHSVVQPLTRSIWGLLNVCKNPQVSRLCSLTFFSGILTPLSAIIMFQAPQM